MKYFLFLDECGDHNLLNFNPDFPVFTLCGVIFNEVEYEIFRNNINQIKRKYWKDKKIIIHSRDIRKCQKGFEILFDLDIKRQFYSDINSLISKSDYTIVASSILKIPYIKLYGIFENVYGRSLSFIMERTVFYLDHILKTTNIENVEIEVIAEKRGKKEDKNLLRYFNRLLDSGTYYVNGDRMKSYFKQFNFKWKRENINGLQIADLLAYPISKHVLEPDSVNFAYDVLKDKFYKKGKRLYGLKVFPG